MRASAVSPGLNSRTSHQYGEKSSPVRSSAKRRLAARLELDEVLHFAVVRETHAFAAHRPGASFSFSRDERAAP